MRRLAVEWAPDTRVNAIAPGPVPTPLTEAALQHPVTGDLIRAYPIPLGRWGHVSDVARAVAWLSSDQASYITGATLFVDGGMTLYPRFV